MKNNLPKRIKYKGQIYEAVENKTREAYTPVASTLDSPEAQAAIEDIKRKFYEIVPEVIYNIWPDQSPYSLEPYEMKDKRIYEMWYNADGFTEYLGLTSSDEDQPAHSESRKNAKKYKNEIKSIMAPFIEDINENYGTNFSIYQNYFSVAADKPARNGDRIYAFKFVLSVINR